MEGREGEREREYNLLSHHNISCMYMFSEMIIWYGITNWCALPLEKTTPTLSSLSKVEAS